MGHGKGFVSNLAQAAFPPFPHKKHAHHTPTYALPLPQHHLCLLSGKPAPGET